MQVLGVAGGSGSGKTTFSRLLLQRLGSERATIISQDSYYIDRSREFRGDGTMNFDHPDAIDWDLMAEQLQQLKDGKTIAVPTYDFATHSRTQKTVMVKTHDLVIVDGILIYSQKPMRELFDLMVFVDCRESVRFQRRLKRDVEERGRTADGVKAQYDSTVLPMHNEFVEPTKRFADEVISGEGDLSESTSSILKKLRL